MGYDYHYYFHRDKGDAIHSVPDVWNIGHRGEPTGIQKRIKGVIPGNDFRISLKGATGIVGFTTQLSAAGATALADTVSLHKAENDWPLPDDYYDGGDRVCQAIVTSPYIVTEETYTIIGAVPWWDKRYTDVSKGFFIMLADRGNRDIKVRLRDIDNNTTLAVYTFDDQSGTAKLKKFDKPTSSCGLIVQVKLLSGGPSPSGNILYSAIIEWE